MIGKGLKGMLSVEPSGLISARSSCSIWPFTRHTFRPQFTNVASCQNL